MGKLSFYKYSGNGNDFIIMDETPLEEKVLAQLCDRHFGIGADGVLMMGSSSRGDTKMRIFNADGKEAEMCGNGLRCVASHLDAMAPVKKDSYLIETMNAVYPVLRKNTSFALEMSEIKDQNIYDLSSFKGYSNSFFINTGVPHLVFLCNEAKKVDIKKEGAFYRFHSMFPNGTNVNFVEVMDTSSQSAYVRTYERGVEDETFSCGTGLTASALALSHWLGWKGNIHLKNKGGNQIVSIGDKIFFSGEVLFCFKGEVEV
jgi:diaminopimelate epimerase